MKYLLDTNVFIFLINNDYNHLSPLQKSIINNPENELFICEASLFEMAIKMRLEKPDFAHFNMTGINRDRNSLHIKLLKSKIDHYENLVSIPKILKKDGKSHADPFDLLIIATAQKESLPILSSDEYFPEYLIITSIS